MIPVGFDTETDRIGPENVVPKLICFTVAFEDGTVCLFANGDDGFREALIEVISEPTYLLVGQKVCFDLSVLIRYDPDLIPIIFQAIEDERIVDIRLREQLLNLSSTGKLEFLLTPDGSEIPIKYSLKNLVEKYLSEDITDLKDADDSWRLNYSLLDGKRSDEYPIEASTYAKGDAHHQLQVYLAQEAVIRGETGPYSVATQHFQVGCDFALRLHTGWGFKIDEHLRDRKLIEIEADLTPEKVNLLVEAGILNPAEPPRPHKRAGPDRMTKGKAATISQTILKQFVESLCAQHDIEIERTPTGRVSIRDEFLTTIASYSPILEQYLHRQKLQKLLTTEIPRISFPIVYPNYDVLKETGRTSSHKDDLFPGVNIQNVDPRIRECYVARPGCVLVSCDYASLELVTLAQKLFDLFGENTLRTMINNGGDPHAYLGACIAYNLDPEFEELMEIEKVKSHQELYLFFKSLETAEDPEVRDFYKKFRTLAKPTGLGFPGGLGPETFIDYARGEPYNQDLVKMYGSREKALVVAQNLRDIWHQTYPEMRRYFEWINHGCRDPLNRDKYAYSSPMGMYRAGASYCAAANGAALQTPAAEGAKLGVWEVARACYDKTMNSILYGCHPLAFIHDEQIVEIPYASTEEVAMGDARAGEISRLMKVAMETIIKDVAVRVEPVMMYRWNKSAKPSFDTQGRLIPWHPKASR